MMVTTNQTPEGNYYRQQNIYRREADQTNLENLGIEIQISDLIKKFEKLDKLFGATSNAAGKASVAEQLNSFIGLLETLATFDQQVAQATLSKINAIAQEVNQQINAGQLNLSRLNNALSELQNDLAKKRIELQRQSLGADKTAIDLSGQSNILTATNNQISRLRLLLRLRYSRANQSIAQEAIESRVNEILNVTRRAQTQQILATQTQLDKFKSGRDGRFPTSEVYDQNGVPADRNQLIRLIEYLFPPASGTIYVPLENQIQTTSSRVIPSLDPLNEFERQILEPQKKTATPNKQSTRQDPNFDRDINRVNHEGSKHLREWQKLLDTFDHKKFFSDLALEVEKTILPGHSSHAARYLKDSERTQADRRGIFYFNAAVRGAKDSIEFIKSSLSGNAAAATIKGISAFNTAELTGLANSEGQEIRVLRFLSFVRSRQLAEVNTATAQRVSAIAMYAMGLNLEQVQEQLRNWGIRSEGFELQLQEFHIGRLRVELQDEANRLRISNLELQTNAVQLNKISYEADQVNQENNLKISIANLDLTKIGADTNDYLYKVGIILSSVREFNQPTLTRTAKIPFTEGEPNAWRNNAGLLIHRSYIDAGQPTTLDGNIKEASAKVWRDFENSHPTAAKFLLEGGIAAQAAIAFLSGEQDAIGRYAPLVKKNNNVSPRRLTREDLISVVPPPSMKNSVPGEQLVPKVPEDKIRNLHPINRDRTPLSGNRSELGAIQKDVYPQAAEMGLTPPFEIQRLKEYFNRNPSHRDALISTWKEDVDKSLQEVLNGRAPSHRSIILNGGWIQVESRPPGETEVSFHFPGINELLNGEIAANRRLLKLKDGVQPTYEEVRNALNASSKETQQVLGDLAVLLKLERLYSAEYNKQDGLPVSDEALGNEKYLPTHLRGIHADALAIWLVTGKEPPPLPIVYSRQGSEGHVLVDVFLEDPRTRLGGLFGLNLGSFPDPKFIGSINGLDREDLRLNKYYPATEQEILQKEIRNWTNWVVSMMKDPWRDNNLFPKNNFKASQMSIGALLWLVNATKRIEGGTLTFPTSTGTPNSTNEDQKSLLAKAAEKFLLDSGYRFEIEDNYVVIRSVNTSGTNEHIDLYNRIIKSDRSRTIGGVPSSPAVTNEQNSQKFRDPVKILVPPEYAHLLK